MSHSIKEINQMAQAEFVRCFGHVFEETPMVAKHAWCDRPFKGIADLHVKMIAVVTDKMTPTERLALIRAHPELGAKEKMADASVQEQASAGLSQLNALDYQKINTLNAAYREKFGFPFIIAVKGLTVGDIVTALETRLEAEKEKEMVRSLSEIYTIASFRLEDLIEDNS